MCCFHFAAIKYSFKIFFTVNMLLCLYIDYIFLALVQNIMTFKIMLQLTSLYMNVIAQY